MDIINTYCECAMSMMRLKNPWTNKEINFVYS